jgi:hypothetical protein
VRHPEMMTTSAEPAIHALLRGALRLQSTSHYRWTIRARRFTTGATAMVVLKGRDLVRVAGEFEVASRCARRLRVVSNFFVGVSERSDFGASMRVAFTLIFLLTSVCADSIQSNSCDRRPLQDSMKNGKGE